MDQRFANRSVDPRHDGIEIRIAQGLTGIKQPLVRPQVMRIEIEPDV
jgi:hypothetical protein